jgi:hypothetical protein
LFLGTEFVLDEFLQKMDFATNVVNRHESEMKIHLYTKSKYLTVLSRAIIDTDGDPQWHYVQKAHDYWKREAVTSISPLPMPTEHRIRRTD